MATTVYVNTDNTGTKDGTTFATGYDNLHDAITAELAANPDRTGDGPLTIYCGGATADGTAVNVDGFTLTANDYILITAHTGYRHAGVWDTNKYRLEVANAVMHISDPFVRVDGIQLYSSSSTEHAAVIYLGASATNAHIEISNCVIRNPGGATNAQKGIWAADAFADVWIFNCVVYGTGANAASYGIYVQTADNVYIYNCTVIGGTYGILRNDGTVVAKNTYASGANGKAWSGTITMTNCSASDTTADGTDPLDSVACDTTEGAGHAGFTNVTAGSEAFTLKSGSALVGAGVTISESAPLNYTTDIAGATRTSPWDIGASEYVVTGQFARPSSDVAGGTFRSIHVTAPFGPRVIA